MFKKITSILISVFMILAFMPIKSKASIESPSDLYVGDQKVTSENTSGTAGDGTWSYDKTTGTLTLNNANITTYHSYGPYKANIWFDDYNFDLTIKLIGNNVLGDGNTDFGIFHPTIKSLTIKGDGSLDIKSTDSGTRNTSNGGGAIIIDENAEVSIKAATGIVGNYVEISNSTVNVTSTSTSTSSPERAGIYAQYTVRISDSSVYVDGGSNLTLGIAAYSGAATFSGDSYIEAGSEVTDAMPVYALGRITLNDGLIVLDPENGRVDGTGIVDSEGNHIAKAIIGQKYTVNATANPTSGGEITGAGEYGNHTTATLTATPNTGYAFVNWTENEEEVSTNATYSFEVTGNRDLVANFVSTYEITATANPTEGGTIEGAGTYSHGDTAQLTATPNDHYNFVNWTENGEEVSTNTTYSFEATSNRALVANFEKQKHTVNFVNYDDKLLQSSEITYGETPAYEGEEPTRPADAKYTYSFAGWNPKISAVTGNTTYKAAYNGTVNKYTIKFVDEDGTELQSGSVPYGETPAYTGETPTKPADDQYTYSFAGWDPEIAKVTGDATYTATYSAEDKTEHSESEGDPDEITPLIIDDNDTPSADDEGLPTYTDSNIDSNTETSQSPADEENAKNVNAPITGDETNLPLWLALASISLVWLTLILVFSKKRREAIDTINDTML